MLGLRFSILAICLVLSLQWIGPVDSKVCKTHDNKAGTCQSIQHCPALQSIVQKLRNKTPLTDKEEILRNSVLPCEEKYTFCCEEPLNPDGLNLLKENESICGGFGPLLVHPEYRPWMALLQYGLRNTTYGRSFMCTGTLITSKFVLTSALCIDDTLVSVRLGEHNLRKTIDCVSYGSLRKCLDRPVDVPVEKVFVHGEFVPGSYMPFNNIALVRLKDPVQFTDFIGPICLPLSPDLQLESQAVKLLEVFSWGLAKKPKGVPKKSFVERVESTASDINDTKTYSIKNNGADSCMWDLGGPLTYPTQYNGTQRFVQAGILSMDLEECGDASLTDVTDVSDFMGWITETIMKID